MTAVFADQQIKGLIADLDTFNSFEVRKNAVIQLGRLGRFDRTAIDNLQRVVRQPMLELSELARRSIELIYLAEQMKKPAMKRTMQTTSVEITAEGGLGLDTESARSFCKCNFCGKETLVTPASKQYTEKLSGPERFYCVFCLRHKFNHRDARHTLMLTFRGIIGYYYYALYSLPKQVHMCLSEIMDHVSLHIAAGAQNPLFLYDPDTFLWFIDFSRVGNGIKKMPIQDVLRTISEILLTFNLMEYIKDVQPWKMYHKYEEAILKFYHQRHRPANSRVLAPTLCKTGAGDYAPERLARELLMGYNVTGTTFSEKRRVSFEDTRNFMPSTLREGLGKKF